MQARLLEQVRAHIQGMKMKDVDKEALLLGRIFQDVKSEWRVPASTALIAEHVDRLERILRSLIGKEKLTNQNVDIVIAKFVPEMAEIMRQAAEEITVEELRTIPLFHDRNDLDRIRNMILGGYLYNVTLGLGNRLGDLPDFDRDKYLSEIATAKLLGAIASTCPLLVAAYTPGKSDALRTAASQVGAVKARVNDDGTPDQKYFGLWSDIDRVTQWHEDKVRSLKGVFKKSDRFSAFQEAETVSDKKAALTAMSPRERLDLYKKTATPEDRQVILAAATSEGERDAILKEQLKTSKHAKMEKPARQSKPSSAPGRLSSASDIPVEQSTTAKVMRESKEWPAPPQGQDRREVKTMRPSRPTYDPDDVKPKPVRTSQKQAAAFEEVMKSNPAPSDTPGASSSGEESKHESPSQKKK